MGWKSYLVIGLLLWLWWAHEKKAKASAAQTNELAGTPIKAIPLPSFGVANVIDAADTVALTGSLPLAAFGLPAGQ